MPCCSTPVLEVPTDRPEATRRFARSIPWEQCHPIAGSNREGPPYFYEILPPFSAESISFECGWDRSSIKIDRLSALTMGAYLIEPDARQAITGFQKPFID